jgi:hypothetical protein
MFETTFLKYQILSNPHQRSFGYSLKHGARCRSVRAFMSHSGLYSMGLPGPSLCRSVKSMSLIGVKSKFSNKSLGEPVSFTVTHNDGDSSPK